MHVESMMTRDVACCTPDTSLSEVARMMQECDCGAIPVVASQDDRQLLGIVTDRDITVRAVAQGMNPLEMNAGAVMSSPVVTVRRQNSIEDTLRVMEEHQVRRVPVVDDNERIVGIVAQADVALQSSDETAGKVVEEISRPGSRSSGGSGGFR
jgi:CBS domain-containing protein